MFDYFAECMVIFVKGAIGSVLWLLVVMVFCLVIGLTIAALNPKKPESDQPTPPDDDDTIH